MARNVERSRWELARLGGEDRHTLYYGRQQLGVIVPAQVGFFVQPFVDHRSKILPTLDEAKAYLTTCFFPAAPVAPVHPAEPVTP